MNASHQGNEGREEGVGAVVTAGSMGLGAWITDGFQLLFLVFISPFQKNRENGGRKGVFFRRKALPRSEIRKLKKSWKKS
jgi:hypothetical protein